MRAVDALEHMARRVISKRRGETIHSDLIREGVAYDEVDRFLHIGPFLGDALREWCDVDSEGEPWEDPETGERLLLGVIFMEGLFVGRRMMRAEVDAELREMVAEVVAAMFGGAASPPPGDDRPPG